MEDETSLLLGGKEKEEDDDGGKAKTHGATAAAVATHSAAAVGGGDDGVPPDELIYSRSVLPVLPNDCMVKVCYAEQIIQELGTIGELFMTYHSGLTFRLQSPRRKGKNKRQDKNHHGIEDYTGPPAFTIQWYAMDFPFGAFLPKLQTSISTPADNTSKQKGNNASPLILQWTNESMAGYTPAIDPDRWTKGEQPVGTISGAIFNAYAEWVPQYCRDRPGYQAFDVWNRVELSQKTKRWIPSNTCSSFTEASLIQLWELSTKGGGSATNKDHHESMLPSVGQGKGIIRRSYFPLISIVEPEKVDMSNPEEAEEVVHFYAELERAIRGGDDADDGAVSTQSFLRMLADKMETFFVYDLNTNTYYRVELSAPYFGLSQLYQPMTLPWQEQLPAGDAGEQRGGGGDFVAEMSNAISGTVSLLRHRLPPILRRKLTPNLMRMLLVPLLIAAVLIPLIAVLWRVYGTMHMQIDRSFLNGFGVGVCFAGLVVCCFFSCR